MKVNPSLKNNLAMLLASSTLWHGIKCAILEKGSTTTNIESTPLEVFGSPRTKSMLISSQGVEATDKGAYIPTSVTLDLACKQFKQLAQWFVFPFSYGSKEFLFNHGQSFGDPKVTHKSPLMHFFDQ